MHARFLTLNAFLPKRDVRELIVEQNIMMSPSRKKVSLISRVSQLPLLRANC